MKLTKTTKKTYEIRQIRWEKPAFKWGKFRDTRKKHGMSVSKFEKCFFCEHKFAEEEDMYIGTVSIEGNRMFCLECANKYKEEYEVSDGD